MLDRLFNRNRQTSLRLGGVWYLHAAPEVIAYTKTLRWHVTYPDTYDDGSVMMYSPVFKSGGRYLTDVIRAVYPGCDLDISLRSQ